MQLVLKKNYYKLHKHYSHLTFPGVNRNFYLFLLMKVEPISTLCNTFWEKFMWHGLWSLQQFIFHEASCMRIRCVTQPLLFDYTSWTVLKILLSWRVKNEEWYSYIILWTEGEKLENLEKIVWEPCFSFKWDAAFEEHMVAHYTG